VFKKTASVTSIGTFSVEDGHLRVAQRAEGDATKSYYFDGARKLNIQSLLEKVAETYAVSADPRDYLFEAIRANTTNCPNENNDGFHQSELLRFDLRLGMPVYMTYAGKPHHVNHKTDNAKAARGVVIDAAYNSDAAALESCPSCSMKTAERANRDETGLHCKKCGHLVKDEYVEILVGVDAKKDPLFADGVRKGTLKAGSMGCSCLSTTCNVCHHVAYSQREFCDHIKRGNKGTYWAKKGNLWTKSSASEVARELAKHRQVFVPKDFCYAKAGNFEARKAYEYCNLVVFDEYSRVDQPADPKALQVEILKAAAKETPSPDVLREESAALIRSAEKYEEAMKRAAQMKQEGIEVNLSPGDDPVVINPPIGEDGQPIEAPIPGELGMGMAPTPVDIDQYTDNELAPGEPVPENEQLELGEMGVLPTAPASAPRHVSSGRRTKKMRKFEAAYKDWTVQVSEQGNARVIAADKKPVLIVKAKEKTQDVDTRRTFGMSILASLFERGLVKTAKKFNATFAPKFAQVVEGASDDMQGFEDKYMHDSVLEDAAENDDMAEARTEPKEAQLGSVLGDHDDMAGDVRGKMPESSVSDGGRDHESKDMGIKNVTDEDNSDMRDKRKPKSPGKDSVLDNEAHDHKEPLAKSGSKYELDGVVHEVVATRLSKGADELKVFGPRSVIVKAGKETKRIAEKDFLAQWKAVDAADAPAVRVAAEKCGACGKMMKEGESKCPCAHEQEIEISVEKAAARASRLAEARIAKIQKEADERVAEAKAAVMESLKRAMRVVAGRFSTNLEKSPLKSAMYDILTEERDVGVDAASGRPIVYQACSDHDLAVHLVESMWQEGAAKNLEAMFERAAALMESGDAFLVAAEKDLSHLKPTIPQVTAAVEAIDEAGLHAEQLRRQASQGNFAFNPAPATNGHDKRSAIRGALGGTLVEAARGRYGLSNG